MKVPPFKVPNFSCVIISKVNEISFRSNTDTPTHAISSDRGRMPQMSRFETKGICGRMSRSCCNSRFPHKLCRIEMRKKYLLPPCPFLLSIQYVALFKMVTTDDCCLLMLLWYFVFTERGSRPSQRKPSHNAKNV
jgi:hypothetical protein